MTSQTFQFVRTSPSNQYKPRIFAGDTLITIDPKKSFDSRDKSSKGSNFTAICTSPNTIGDGDGDGE